MGDTVSYSLHGTQKNTLWVVLRLIFCAFLLPGSCLHLFTSTCNLRYKTGTKMWHPHTHNTKFNNTKFNFYQSEHYHS